MMPSRLGYLVTDHLDMKLGYMAITATLNFIGMITRKNLDRFYTTLDQSDVIVMTSNRQWGTTVRVPERYPLTSEYYRALLGCPEDEDLLKCYCECATGDVFRSIGF